MKKSQFTEEQMAYAVRQAERHPAGGHLPAVRRLYRLEGLQLRMRMRRCKHIALHRPHGYERSQDLITRDESAFMPVKR